MHLLRISASLAGVALFAGCGDGSVGQYPSGSTSETSSSSSGSTSSDGSTSESTTGSSSGDEESSGSSTGSPPTDACGDAPGPHLCDASGTMCLCLDTELGDIEYWLWERLAVGDIDSDGNVDIAYVSSSGGVFVRLSDGDALSDPVQVSDEAPVLFASEVGVAYYDDSGSEPVLGMVAPTALEPPFPLASPLGESVEAGDFDGNGKLDLFAPFGDETATWGRTLMNVEDGPVDTVFEIGPPTVDMAAWIPAIADFDGDGLTDVVVSPLYSPIQLIALGSADGLGPFAELPDPIEAEGSLIPFGAPNGGGQLYMQPGACSDCTPPVGSFSVYEYVGPAGFERLGTMPGSSRLWGRGARPLVTPHGSLAVTLSPAGTLVTSAGTLLEFRDALDFDSPPDYTVVSKQEFEVYASVPFEGEERLIVRVGNGNAMSIFSLEVIE